MKILVEKIPCQNCGSSRTPALQVYREDEETSGYCFSCEKSFIDPYNGVVGTRKKGKNALQQDLDELTYLSNLKDITKEESMKDTEILPLEDRGVDLTTCKFYGVKAELDKFDNTKIVKHFYPYTKGGIVTGYKIRNCKDKEFLAEGDLKSAELFGQNRQSSNKKNILVHEGELDAMSSWQMLKSRGKKIDSVSTSGANARGIKDNWEFLNEYENILVVYDMDEPGKKAAEQIPELFEPGKVRIVNLPPGYKDTNELLQDKEADGAAIFAKCLREASQRSPDGVVGVADILEQALLPKAKGLSLPWKSMTEITGGIRTGELWTFTAGSGCVDYDTEYLSPYGWKKIGEYQGGAIGQIVGLNKLEFVQPQRYIKQPSKALQSIDTKYGLSMTLSNDHNVISFYDSKLDGGSRAKRISKASDFIEKHRTLKNGNKDTILTSFNYSGHYNTGYFEDYLRLKVAVFADGCFEERYRTNVCHINIKKQRKKVRLEHLLDNLNMEYSSFTKTDGFTCFSFTMDNRDKNYPKDWWQLSTKEKKIIADEIFFWDGDQKSTYFTTNYNDAAFIQFLFSSLDYRASLTTIDRRGETRGRYTRTSIDYEVRITERRYVGLSSSKGKPKFKKVETVDGYQYCFTVPTNQLLLRCRKRIFITGNSGKTTGSREIMHHLMVEHKVKTGFIFLEERAPKTLQTLAGMQKGVLYHKQEVISDKKAFKKDVVKFKDLAYFYDSFGQNSWHSIKAKIRYFAQALGIKYIALDNLTAITAHAESEYNETNVVMAELAALVNELDINIQLISHLRKSPGSKAFEEGGQISSADLRGSSAINFWSYYIFAVERNTQSEDDLEKNTSTVRVLKDRVDGRVGDTFSLFYDKETGRWVETEIKVEDF